MWFLPFSSGPNSEKIDLVVTLGGDGTILHASSLFSVGAVPPVLSFSMGTLGFLLPFREPNFYVFLNCFLMGNEDIDDFAKALDSVFKGSATILNRMRLSCTFFDYESGKAGADEDGKSNVLIPLDLY